jgi:chorismate mutase
LQTDRWQEIMQKALTKSQTLDLSERFIDRLFKAIHQESIEKQEKIINRLIK